MKGTDFIRQGHQIITRLLGRPQPQMYPPVALNQYTLVNRTHKHFLYNYAARPHENFEIFGGSWGTVC